MNGQIALGDSHDDRNQQVATALGHALAPKCPLVLCKPVRGLCISASPGEVPVRVSLMTPHLGSLDPSKSEARGKYAQGFLQASLIM